MYSTVNAAFEERVERIFMWAQCSPDPRPLYTVRGKVTLLESFGMEYMQARSTRLHSLASHAPSPNLAVVSQV